MPIRSSSREPVECHSTLCPGFKIIDRLRSRLDAGGTKRPARRYDRLTTRSVIVTFEHGGSTR